MCLRHAIRPVSYVITNVMECSLVVPSDEGASASEEGMANLLDGSAVQAVDPYRMVSSFASKLMHITPTAHRIPSERTSAPVTLHSLQISMPGWAVESS